MPEPLSESLRIGLRRLGEDGARAELFLQSAAVHLDAAAEDPMAAHHAAYAMREALMAIVGRGGARPRGMKESAEEVVRRFTIGGDNSQRLDEAIRSLADVLAGPGPNEVRLERAVSELARLPATRASADLIERFITALGTANQCTHASSPPQHRDVLALYEDVIVILEDLFGPLSERLAVMDDLVGEVEPGPEHVLLLKQRLGDERRLVYLFDSVHGPGWFRALRDDPLLLPPPQRAWTAGPYVARTAQSYPDDVREWLASVATSDLNAKQTLALLRIARLVDGDVRVIVRGLARAHMGDTNVRMQVDAYIRDLTPDQRDTAEIRSLMQRLLASALADRQGSLDAYMAAEELALGVAATSGPHAAAWFKMLAHRTREVAQAQGDLRLRVLPPISELTLDPGRQPLELVASALRAAVNAAADAGLPLDERVAILKIVPEPLSHRLIAQHLLDGFPDTAAEAREFLIAQMATNIWPSPEELALVRATLEHAGENAAEVGDDLAAALGPAPTADVIRGMSEEEASSDDMIRAHRWLVAFPPEAAPDWHAADQELAAYLVPASPDGVMMRSGAASFGVTAPLQVADLAGMTPLDVAKVVAAWRPEQPASFLGPSAEGLAGTLRRVIDEDIESWAQADIVEIARALHEPLYIAVFIQALHDQAQRLAGRPEAVVDLVELVRSEPWLPGDLGTYRLGDQNVWLAAGVKALELLGRFGEVEPLGGEAAERAWTQIRRAVEARDDNRDDLADGGDPLTRAVNRPSMRALDLALTVGAKSDGADPHLIDLLDEALNLDGIDGLHARAIMARRLPWLRHIAADWFLDRAGKTFGVDAPNGLGPATVDLYLEWSNPDRNLLLEHRTETIDALARDQHEDAIRHLLHGLLWNVDGHDPGSLAAVLATAGDSAASFAGHWLGWALADIGDDVDLRPVVELWRELLDRDLAPKGYLGFGWMAVASRLGDEDWLTLTEATLSKTGGNLEEPERVAERAGSTPTDPRSARILTHLLSGDPKPWDLQRIGAVGLEILPHADDETASELRERLLERGFFEARGS
jgi:hypothetical protein